MRGRFLFVSRMCFHPFAQHNNFNQQNYFIPTTNRFQMNFFTICLLALASISAVFAGSVDNDEFKNKFANQPRLNDTVISCGSYQSDACNCVAYARDRQPKLPTGLTYCSDKTAHINSHTAAAGCVMFRDGDPTYCHAAYVTSVSGGTVYYDQANWTHCECSKDSLPTGSSHIMGYWCP